MLLNQLNRYKTSLPLDFIKDIYWISNKHAVFLGTLKTYVKWTQRIPRLRATILDYMK